MSTNSEKARKQGGGSVCDYAIHFYTLVVESGWNTTAFYDIFLKGLSTPIWKLLVPLDLPPYLDSLIAQANWRDNWIHELHLHWGG